MVGVRGNGRDTWLAKRCELGTSARDRNKTWLPWRALQFCSSKSTTLTHGRPRMSSRVDGDGYAAKNFDYVSASGQPRSRGLLLLSRRRDYPRVLASIFGLPASRLKSSSSQRLDKLHWSCLTRHNLPARRKRLERHRLPVSSGNMYQYWSEVGHPRRTQYWRRETHFFLNAFSKVKPIQPPGPAERLRLEGCGRL